MTLSRFPPTTLDHFSAATDLADYIEFCDVDILCLSEIEATDRAGGRWTNETLTEAFSELSQRGGEDWTHELFPDSNGGGTQLTGIAWDQSAVAALGDEWRFPVSHALSTAGRSGTALRTG